MDLRVFPSSKPASAISKLVPRSNFPSADFSTDDAIEKSMEQLRRHAEEWTEFFIQYYDRVAKRRMYLANTLRTFAILSLLIGTIFVAGRLLPPDWQETLVKALAPQAAVKTVPAEFGLILFGMAAGMILADRFGNISANWLRYRSTAMQLERRLLEFRLAWWESALRPAEPPTDGESTSPLPDIRQRAMTKLAAVDAFVAATFDLVEGETREWASLFRQSQDDFASYLRTANEAVKERAAKTGRGKPKP